jgi:hypothetical protein
MDIFDTVLQVHGPMVYLTLYFLVVCFFCFAGPNNQTISLQQSSTFTSSQIMTLVVINAWLTKLNIQCTRFVTFKDLIDFSDYSIL